MSKINLYLQLMRVDKPIGFLLLMWPVLWAFLVSAEGSPNVIVNGIPWSRQGDVNTPHLLTGDPCPVHAAPIAVGSPTVIVNGVGAGRIGDAIAGCTLVAAGSPNVFAGP